MIKTKIKKAIAIASIAALAATSIGSSTFAAVIGTAGVLGQATTDVVWDDTFPGTATGTVNNVIVTAQVLPTLNMVVSTGTIDLGILAAGIESTGSLNIEIGTNAANGVSITARSGSGGLTNTSDSLVKINDTDADGESYTFESLAKTHDSNATGFIPSLDVAVVEVNNNTNEYPVYSTNKPEADDNTNEDVEFIVSATAIAETTAGNYQDTITFTVTGNF